MNTENTQVVVYVSYQGRAEERFDRQYYVDGHLPLVMKLCGRLLPAAGAAGNPGHLRMHFPRRGGGDRGIFLAGSRRSDGGRAAVYRYPPRAYAGSSSLIA